MAVGTEGMLKISELAERSGVSSATIKHYLREGLLGDQDDVLRTSRNMAYYPPHFVDRVRLIKRLQEERFMPLRVIRQILGSDPDRAVRLIELEDRILEQAVQARDTDRVSRTRVRQTYDMPANVLERLEQLAILSPNSRGYDSDDVAIIEAISRFRAGGYEEVIGFTVYDTLRYRKALEPLVEEEVMVLLERLGAVEVDRAVEIISSGAEPLRDLIGAMHSKLLLAALRRQRDRGSPEPHAHTRREVTGRRRACTVRPVPVEQTRALRRQVLRPHQTESELASHEPPEAYAVGAFEGEQLVAVGLIGREGEPGEWRIRGMAAAPEVRGRGAGTAVLSALVDHARHQYGRAVWCLARTRALGVYQRAGFEADSEEFELPEIGPHVRMRLRLG